MRKQPNLSLDADYLGFLAGQLRNLKGYATLANELIQNADDAKASEIVFDVQEKELIVTNDGKFSDCGTVDQKPECPWVDQRNGLMCDFHRFRKTAAGNKRREEDTTGAYGIGFISVYQITDQPELSSGVRYWVIKPEKDSANRVEPYELFEGEMIPGTKFRFPWARDPKSVMRQELQSEAITDTEVELLVQEIEGALPTTVLFLKHLRHLVLKREGHAVRVIDRTGDGKQIVVRDGDRETAWHLFEGDFRKEEQHLRQRYSTGIEIKRKSNVLVAMPVNADAFQGILCATLPTKQTTGLPFHINADFFPTLDRKRVLEENDHQGVWNDAALRAASETVARHLPKLAQALGHETFWDCVHRIKTVHTEVEQKRSRLIYGAFWDLLHPQLNQSECVLTTENLWRKPASTVFIQEKIYQPDQLRLLDHIGLQVIHQDLRKYHNILANLGATSLQIRTVAAGLQSAGLSNVMPLHEAPEWFQSEEIRQNLADLMTLLAPNLTVEDRKRLSKCAIAVSKDNYLCPPEELWDATDELIEILHPFGFGWRYAAANPEPVKALTNSPNVEQIIGQLERVPAQTFSDLWRKQPDTLIHLIDWLASQSAATWTDLLIERLRRIPLWPSGNDTQPLTNLYVPGGFDDPLGLTSLVHGEVVKNRKDYLCKILRVPVLEIERYVREALPKALASGQPVSNEICRVLTQVLAENLGKFKGDTDAAKVLAKHSLVRDERGTLHPASQVYFKTDLVQNVFGGSVRYAKLPAESFKATEDFYRWLGVSDKPQGIHIAQYVERITQNPPTDDSRTAIQNFLMALNTNWEHLKEQESQLNSLKERAWLPSERDKSLWFKPSNVYTAYSKHLFETQANFLDLPRNHQGRDFFGGFLNLPSNPNARQVAGHLRECIKTAIAPNSEVYTFLQQAVDDASTHDCLTPLRDMDCLCLGGSRFVRPNEVFWSENPFGKYAQTLGTDFQRFRKLFDWLGVREKPNAKDAIRLLKRLSEDHRKTHSPLDEQDQSIIHRCWSLIQKHIDQEQTLSGDLKTLRGFHVILDDRKMLMPPELMYLEDRVNIAARFDKEVRHHLAERHIDTFRVLLEAGVSLLSRSVKSEFLECEGEREVSDLTQLLQRRRMLIRRVINAQNKGSDESWDYDLLSKIRFIQADYFRVVYRLPIGTQWFPAEPEAMPAYYDPRDDRLYLQYAEDVPWAAIAREIANALNPEIEPGPLAAPMMEVLRARTEAVASATLDELGFAPLEQFDVASLDAAEPASMGFEEDHSEFVEASGSVEAFNAFNPDANADANDFAIEDALLLRNGTDPGIVHPQPTMFGNPATSNTNSIGTPRVNGMQSPPTDSPTHFAPNPATQGSRLYSYVSRVKEPTQASLGETEHRDRVGKAGVEYALAYEVAHGRMPKEMPYAHPGYDIESQGDNDQIERYIEVKAIPTEWGDKGVGLSDTQFKKAQELGDLYWLYVVENVESDDYGIIPIQDPARKVTHFYFDHGWREAD